MDQIDLSTDYEEKLKEFRPQDIVTFEIQENKKEVIGFSRFSGKCCTRRTLC